MAQLMRLGAIALLGLALASCDSGASPSPSATASQTPMGSDGMEADTGALGEPADAAKAGRTIQIKATNALAFEPNTVKVKVGETVTFKIENTGTVDHEFILGSASFQDEHGKEMQSGEMEMAEPNELHVPAGKTASLTWHFTEAGTTKYGCHEPGHFPAGMVGTITVSK